MTDEELWEQWKKTHREKDLLPLLERYEPFVNKQLAIFGQTNISPTLIKAKAQMNLIDAFKTYDPKQGVKLNTHVNWHMQKMKRFVTTHQNFARIPEPMVFRISEYTQAEDKLTHRLGRAPSIKELADELKWPLSHVERMQKVLRKDLSLPLYDLDPAQVQSSQWNMIQNMLPYELGDKEVKVFEAISKARKPLSDNALAKKLNMSPFEVRKSRLAIIDKVKQFGQIQ